MHVNQQEANQQVRRRLYQQRSKNQHRAKKLFNESLIYQIGSFNKGELKFIRQDNHKPETQIITEVKKSNNRSCSFNKSLRRSNFTKKIP